MTNLKRLIELSGINEDEYLGNDDDDEYQDRLDTERYHRSEKIKILIAKAFKIAGIEIAEHGIYYDEESDRMANIKIDDYQIDLAVLARITTSGLSNKYMIQAVSENSVQGIEIECNILPELDNAILN